MRSSASRAYLDHLAEQQAEATTDISKNLGRDVAAEQTYRHALNGIAVALAPEEAELVAQLPGVVAVEPDQLWQLDTDVSNEIIDSPAVWGGETGTDVGTRGEGVLVGMIDSGRATELMDSLLQAVAKTRARFAILDLTGVEEVDTGTAGHLLALVRAVRLLGAEGVITGIHPNIAQTIVAIGVDLSRVHVFATLRDALKHCISRADRRA